MLRLLRLPHQLLVTAVFLLVQLRVSVLLSRAARRFTGGRRRAARLGIVAMNLAVAGGYACSYAELLSKWGIPPHPGMLAGAATLLYLLTAGIVVCVHAVWSLMAERLCPPLEPSRRRLLTVAGGAAVAGPLAVLAYGSFVERFAFRVREVDIPLPGLPADLDGLRIAQISDIHLSAFLSRQELARVIDSSNELRPNLAVITGDLISSRGDPLDDCIREIARLKTDAGIYGCMGNHERYARAEDYTQAFAAGFGIPFLRSQAIPLRFGAATLNLAGVDYQRTQQKRDYLRGAERLVTPGVLNVLLSHNPDVFPVAARQGFELMLAGHTHGGQVTIEILDQAINPARFFTRYVYGLYRSGRAAGYVTRGIGTIGIPVRIGAPPEITLLRLRKA